MLHNLLVDTDTDYGVKGDDGEGDGDAEGGVNMDGYHVAENHQRREALVDQMMRIEGLTAEDAEVMIL